MTATAETIETFDKGVDEEALEAEIMESAGKLNRLREKNGKKPIEMPDLSTEKQELAEESESIFKKAWNVVKKTLDFLVVKPIKWVGRQIKEHPIRTLLIALVAFGIWYQWGSFQAGYSVIKETGAKEAAKLLGKGISVDPPLIPGDVTFDFIT